MQYNEDGSEAGHVLGSAKESRHCTCRPRILDAGGGTITVHNSFATDRRLDDVRSMEQYESEMNPQRLPHHWLCGCDRCKPTPPPTDQPA